MTALGNNVHIFARPTRRETLNWLFETVLQIGPVAKPVGNRRFEYKNGRGGGTLFEPTRRAPRRRPRTHQDPP
jgi:hypothetical protein